MVLFGVRVFFLLAVVAVTLSYAYQGAVVEKGSTYVTWYIILPAVAALALVMSDIFWKRKRLQVLSGLFFGVLAGLTIAWVLTLVVDMVVDVFPTLRDRNTVELVKVLLGVAAVFLCVSFVMQTKDDFRFVIPYVEFAKQAKGSRPVLLDTSVIIDGRINDIAQTGFLESQVIVPRFVLNELHAIADSDDKLKRTRGRRGLDILNSLREREDIDLEILDVHVTEVDELADVDSKLVALAKHLDGKVVTNDYNLNKVARLRGVQVININDLANALKPVVLPGETMKVKIIKPGEEQGQGVGYLDDGTMVVAEQARDQVGQEITIAVTSVLQTSAGRMIFGRMEGGRGPSRRDR